MELEEFNDTRPKILEKFDLPPDALNRSRFDPLPDNEETTTSSTDFPFALGEFKPPPDNEFHLLYFPPLPLPDHLPNTSVNFTTITIPLSHKRVLVLPASSSAARRSHPKYHEHHKASTRKAWREAWTSLKPTTHSPTLHAMPSHSCQVCCLSFHQSKMGAGRELTGT